MKTELKADAGKIVMVYAPDIQDYEAALRMGRRLSASEGCGLHVVSTQPRANAYIPRYEAMDRFLSACMQSGADTTVLYTDAAETSLMRMLSRYAIAILVLDAGTPISVEQRRAAEEMGIVIVQSECPRVADVCERTMLGMLA